MKKIQFLFALLFIFTIFSCGSEQAEIQQELAAQNLEPSIEQQILDAHNIFSDLRKTDPTVSILFKMEGQKLVSVIGQEAETANNGSNERTEEYCRGEGISFAKCVKEMVDKHGCVVITTCVYCATPCKP